MATRAAMALAGLIERTEARRVGASAELGASRRGELGQFLTPAPIADLLASMFAPCSGSVRLLDPGAGVGSLTAATLARAGHERWPAEFETTAIEVDEDLMPFLKETLSECGALLNNCSVEAIGADFHRVGMYSAWLRAVRQMARRALTWRS